MVKSSEMNKRVGINMRIRTLKYWLTEGGRGLVRNRLMSLASIATIGACLFILGIAYCVVANIDYILLEIDETIGITAFIKEDTEENEIQRVLNKLENRSEVKSVKYVTPEEAWKSFKESLGEDEALLEGLGDDNPLENSASFEITLNDINKQDQIIGYLDTFSEIRKVNHSKQSVDILVSFGKLIRYISVAIISILIFIAILLMNNTIKLTVFMRKNEINIMKYIGATDAFVRGPFIVEGILIGVITALFVTLVFIPVFSGIVNLIYENIPGITNLINFIDINSLKSTLFALFIIIGLGIGIIGSKTSIRKYLKV